MAHAKIGETPPKRMNHPDSPTGDIVTPAHHPLQQILMRSKTMPQFSDR